MNKKIVIPALAVAAAAGIGGAVYVNANKVDPKTAVTGAFLSLAEEREKLPQEELFGLRALSQAHQENPYQEEMSVLFLDASEKNYAMLKNASLTIDSKKDSKAFKNQAEIGIGIGGLNLGEIELYLNEDEFDLSVPSLLETTFSLNYMDADDAVFKKSFVNNLIKASGFDLQILADALKKSRGLNDYMKEEAADFTVDGFLTMFKELEAAKACYDQTRVEKVGKVKITVDGVEQDAVQYKVTIPNDAASELMRAVRGHYQEFIDKLEELQKENSATSTVNLENYDKMIQAFDENFGDISMDVIVRKDGKMGSFNYELPVLPEKLEGVDKVTGALNCKGGYMLGAVADGYVAIEGDKSVKCEFSQNSQYAADSAWTNDVAIQLAFDEQKYTLNYDWDYQIPEKDYSLNVAVLEQEKELIKVTSEGILECEEKGSDLNLEADSIKVAVDALGTTQSFEFEVDYKTKPYNGEIQAPEGTVVDVLAVTEDDINKIIEEITGKVFGLLLQIYSVIG